MIRAKYSVTISEKYKLVKVLDKFSKYFQPYVSFKIKGKIVEVSAPKREIIGELQRRLKHMKNCSFKMIEIESVAEGG